MATGIPAVRYGVRVQAGGKTYMNPSRGQDIFTFSEASYSMYIGFSSPGDIKFTTHLYLVAGLRMSGAILLILLYALMAWKGTWPFFFYLGASEKLREEDILASFNATCQHSTGATG